MDDLFGGKPSPASRPSRPDRPLADRLRPKSLAGVVGQDAVLQPTAPLGRMLAAKHLGSIILWGPPGCGKTTMARLLAAEVGEQLIPLSAVMSGVADLRKSFEQARKLGADGRRPILFIDEIHRFNRVQQDGLLHEVEDGTVTLIGATTENPSFALNSALISRCHVIILERLSKAALSLLVARSAEMIGHELPIDTEALNRLTDLADGDGRYLLNMVESLADLPSEPVLTPLQLGDVLQQRMPVYDRQYEAHYNLISALHKSIRGSDPDAALYWLNRMFEGGEDPRYVARRLIRMANEDIGLADPQAIQQALAAAKTYERLGSPEGELALAQCAVYLAIVPKSNALYLAQKAANKSAKQHGSLMPPKHILNAPTRLMKELGYGKDYHYDHDAPDRFSGQNYFPDDMERECFYQPTDQGREGRFRERMAELSALRQERQR